MNVMETSPLATPVSFTVVHLLSILCLFACLCVCDILMSPCHGISYSVESGRKVARRRPSTCSGTYMHVAGFIFGCSLVPLMASDSMRLTTDTAKMVSNLALLVTLLVWRLPLCRKKCPRDKEHVHELVVPGAAVRATAFSRSAL